MDSVYVKCEGLVAKHVFDADLALDSKKGASTRSAAKVESVCELVCGAFFWKSISAFKDIFDVQVDFACACDCL